MVTFGFYLTKMKYQELKEGGKTVPAGKALAWHTQQTQVQCLAPHMVQQVLPGVISKGKTKRKP